MNALTRPPPRGLVVRAADDKTVVRPRLPPIGGAIRCLPFHAAAMALQTVILMVGTWLKAPFSASGNLALGLALAGTAGWGAV